MLISAEDKDEYLTTEPGLTELLCPFLCGPFTLSSGSDARNAATPELDYQRRQVSGLTLIAKGDGPNPPQRYGPGLSADSAALLQGSLLVAPMQQPPYVPHPFSKHCQFRPKRSLPAAGAIRMFRYIPTVSVLYTRNRCRLLRWSGRQAFLAVSH